MTGRLFLIHGNQEAEVAAKRYDLVRSLLPHGEEDGEVVDLRPPGNQAYALDRALGDIIQEMGTVSLIPDAKRVVVVYELTDFRQRQKGSVREARKSAAGKKDHVASLEQFLKATLSDGDNSLIFVHNDDDEKNRRVEKSSPLYQLVARLGQVHEFTEKRIDWQLEDALLAGNLAGSIALTREWLDRGGNASFRLVMTINSFLQLLLQARIEGEAREQGDNVAALLAGDLRPSLMQIPDFKRAKYRALARRVPTRKIRDALVRLVDVQKSFFPTGEERVVHDAAEQVETLYVDLVAAP